MTAPAAAAEMSIVAAPAPVPALGPAPARSLERAT